MKRFLKENAVYIIIVLMTVAINYIKLPFYIDTPGGVIDISDRIELEGEDVEVNGSLNMLYVSEYVATIPTYLLSFVIKDWDRESIQNVRVSDESASDIYERSRVMLDNSIDNAMYVAYSRAGRDVKIKDYENVVVAVTFENGLKIGDEILEVDDREIKNVEELKKIITNCQVGQELKVKVLRDGDELEVFVKVVEEEGNKLIGVMVITNYDLDVEPEVEIRFKESESGSSGGLMMALSIYNALSDEDIIKGRNIAGTGTISMSGMVGEIDGIKYKIMGAFRNHMDIVLVPKGNYVEAMKVKEEKNYDIEIVSVDTFDDAIEYLKSTK